MNCLITAGPTWEPLDEVRRLTNHSTGRLGTLFANYLVSKEFKVMLLIGRGATWSGPCQAPMVRHFTTGDDLHRQLAECASASVDAVFHAAAVSDFKFGGVFEKAHDGRLIPLTEGKISSRSGPLLAELVPTSKIIRNLRDWFPRALLAGWKYEVGGGRASAMERAQSQIAECRTDVCVVNGPAYGDGFGLVQAGELPRHFERQAELFEALVKLLLQHTKPTAQ